MKQFLVSKIKKFKSWDELKTLTDFSYPWLEEQSPKTQFKAYHDTKFLFFYFRASGANPLVYVKDNNKMEVIHSERVELFFRTNENIQPYYCFEMDPNGRVLDYRAELYRKFDREWVWPESFDVETKIDEDGYTVQGKFSLRILEQLGVLSNQQIQTGIYRGYCVSLKGDKAKLKWISWVDSKTPKPDFHVASSFGLLVLE